MRKLATIMALVVALAVPTSAFAGGTAPATDSLTILSTFTLEGVPGSLTYTQRSANYTGMTWLAPSAQTPANNTVPSIGLVHVVKFGGSDGSVRLWLDMTDLVGRQTIPASARRFYTENLSAAEQLAACASWNAYTQNPGGNAASYTSYNPATNAGKTLAVTTGATDCAAINVSLGVDIPTGITGDVLTGTVTFNVGP